MAGQGQQVWPESPNTKLKIFKNLEKDLLTKKKIHCKDFLLLLQLYYNLQTYLIGKRFK
jgi:hypothetical protein